MTTQDERPYDVPAWADRAKLVVRGLYDAQKLRIQLELRIGDLVRKGAMTKDEAKTFFNVSFGHLERAEKEMEKLVWREVKDLAITKRWLKHVKGIGPRLSGLLIANIAPIDRFPNVAKLWAYAGLHTIDGGAAKRTKGKKANWNAELKTTAWKIGGSFLKSGGPYRELYDRYKRRILEREVNRGTPITATIEGKAGVVIDWRNGIDETLARIQDGTYTAMIGSQTADEIQSSVASHSDLGNQCTDASPGVVETQPENANHTIIEVQCDNVNQWSLGRINNMAQRYTAKMFLSHLWSVWRELEGLPVRMPYAIEYLGHETYIDPWGFADVEQKPKRKAG